MTMFMTVEEAKKVAVLGDRAEVGMALIALSVLRDALDEAQSQNGREDEGKTRKVLDNGFVRLESHMGGDAAVTRSARVSYGKSAKTPEDDKKLIRYMLEHHHGTPFEHAVFTFHVKCPIFVMRQWIRHRMGSFNETSMRYREAPDEFYSPSKWRAQDTKNKQGSVAADVGHELCTAILDNHGEESMQRYRTLLDRGVAKEMARLVLPVNLYTEFYWTVNARALMHFIGLRSEHHAQWEMRQYSNALWWFFAETMRWTAEAFTRSLDLQRYVAGEGDAVGPHLGLFEDTHHV